MLETAALPTLDRAAYFGQHFTFWAQSIALTQTARRMTRQAVPDVPKAALKQITKRFLGLLRQDLKNVEAGLYPRELLFQIPFRQYAAQLPRILADAPNIWRRIRNDDYLDLPTTVNLRRYPAYYRRTFHWQTDGYLSRRSAELYDVGVEILFRGMADVMRRQVIPPITRHLRERALRPGRSDVVRLLDVACGTGRTLSQIAKAHPALSYFGVDLSPFYVQMARKNLARVADVWLLAENAEALPFPDGYFQIVTSVHLFHELPRNTRRQVVAEMLRVLEPGGLLVIEDSAQVSDSPELAPVLANFAKDFHEPFYRDYTQDDLAALLAEVGFEAVSSQPELVAKVVVARKRAEPASVRSARSRAGFGGGGLGKPPGKLSRRRRARRSLTPVRQTRSARATRSQRSRERE